MKTIVFAALDPVQGEGLSVLQDCLHFLSREITVAYAKADLIGTAPLDVKVIVIVPDKSVCDYPGIEYIELKEAEKTVAHRLWYKRVKLPEVSRDLEKRFGELVDVWISTGGFDQRIAAKEQKLLLENGIKEYIKTIVFPNRY